MERYEWVDERGWKRRAVRLGGGAPEIFENFLLRPGTDSDYQPTGCEYSPQTAEMLRLAIRVKELEEGERQRQIELLEEIDWGDCAAVFDRIGDKLSELRKEKQ